MPFRSRVPAFTHAVRPSRLIFCIFQESLPSAPSEKQIGQAQQRLATCVGNCAVEYEKKLPKLRVDIVQQLQAKS